MNDVKPPWFTQDELKIFYALARPMGYQRHASGLKIAMVLTPILILTAGMFLWMLVATLSDTLLYLYFWQTLQGSAVVTSGLLLAAAAELRRARRWSQDAFIIRVAKFKVRLERHQDMVRWFAHTGHPNYRRERLRLYSRSMHLRVRLRELQDDAERWQRLEMSFWPRSLVRTWDTLDTYKLHAPRLFSARYPELIDAPIPVRINAK